MAYFTIRLQNLRFYSRIGVLNQEREVGNEFVVNVSFVLEADNFEEENLGSTANYANIYAIVENVMGERLQLLETAAKRIADKIHAYLSSAKEIKVGVTKITPPVSGIQGSATVEYTL